jgi:SynChlorMet cassette protein ScmC
MNKNSTNPYSKGYHLSLSDGSSWWMTGDHSKAEWVDRFAAILELEECAVDGSPNLIFTRMADTDDAKDKTRHIFPPQLRSWGYDDAGWMSYTDKTLRVWWHNTIPDIICEIKDYEDDDDEEKKLDISYISMWTSLRPIFLRSIDGGGLPFHAGLAELDGRSILIAAPGDVGKSTSCRRLPKYWTALSDDEALVVLTKQKQYRTHPFPTWSDYLWRRKDHTWNVQYSVPLSAIFFLEQSETDEVLPAGAGESAILVSESAIQVCRKFWRSSDKEDERKYKRQIFNNACEMTKNIPAFHLRATLHGKFWEEIEKALGWSK